MATFWEIAARLVSNLFSLYFVYLLYLFISRFGFKSEICLLIAPVPVHCFSITSIQSLRFARILGSYGNQLYLYGTRRLIKIEHVTGFAGRILQ